MSKLIGKRKLSYLAQVVGEEPSVSAETAAKLTERLDEAIRSIRVTKAGLAKLKGGDVVERVPSPPVSPAVPSRPSAPFDPYAFNAILVFKRSGRDGLVARLGQIAEIGHLRQLAEAQLIGLDNDMRSGPVDIEELREAVLRGVERLVADRRAAAS